MGQDFSDLLEHDILQSQHQLHQMIQHMAEGTITADIVSDALIAAHTLKGLTAVKGMAHLEAYAAQLEQLFLEAQKLPPAIFSQQFQTSLTWIETEFQSACTALELEKKQEVLDLPINRIAKLVHRVQQMNPTPSGGYVSANRQKKADSIFIETLFEAFIPWIYRAAETTHKKIDVTVLVPEPIEIKPKLATPIQTMLVHLLRNAVFHGIEPPTVRKDRRKPQTGTVQIRAEVHQDALTIMISDDGRGLKGESWPTGQDQPLESDAFAHELSSGSIFSIRSETGLGIGLHIVQSQLESLQGSLEFKSIPNMGTSVILNFPLRNVNR